MFCENEWMNEWIEWINQSSIKSIICSSLNDFASTWEGIRYRYHWRRQHNKINNPRAQNQQSTITHHTITAISNIIKKRRNYGSSIRRLEQLHWHTILQLYRRSPFCEGMNESLNKEYAAERNCQDTIIKCASKDISDHTNQAGLLFQTDNNDITACQRAFDKYGKGNENNGSHWKLHPIRWADDPNIASRGKICVSILQRFHDKICISCILAR